MPTRTEAHARDIVRDALTTAAPGADLDSLGDHDDLRDTLELDSVDFLAFVERLGTHRGERIDEDDYPRLGTLADCVAFLTGQD
jgi:acyl carrier protein